MRDFQVPIQERKDKDFILTTFEELYLAAPILKAIDECGHNEPTPVQAEAIPKTLSGCDLLASAQTGTGKTAAFVLPALQRLASLPADYERGLRVLVVTPTRELATQITKDARTYAKYLNVHTVAIFGGMPDGDQLRALAQLPDMVVATPGRLIDFIWRGKIDLSRVEMLVLDEADRMLDMGFISDVEFIADAMPENCQTLLFAATMGEATTKLAQQFMKNPERVEIAPGQITHERIEQRLHMADSLQHKNHLLRRLCEDSSVTRAIIFSATKRETEKLARELSAQGYAAAALHSDMSQAARNRTIADMHRGKIRLLAATDVAARGLHITGVSHVINFDLPRSAEDYVNRIGRTGRAGESGIAISFASQADLPYLDRIQRYLGENLSVQILPGLEPKGYSVKGNGAARGNRKTRGAESGNGKKRSISENDPSKFKKGAVSSGEQPERGKSRTAEQDKPMEKVVVNSGQINLFGIRRPEKKISA
jgi:superfamily II DNA/RNA helicase